VKKSLSLALCSTLSFVSPSEAFSHCFALAPYRQETGIALGSEWVAEYGRHAPGYLLGGFKVAPVILPTGTYQYTFYMQRGPGHLRGLFSGANEAVRLEIFDRTTNERLAARSFEQNDFERPWKRAAPKHVVFSTWGRAGHAFEPRLYWPGLVSISLKRVELQTLDAWSENELRAKADRFEAQMSARFIENGYVVMRDSVGQPADVDDTALWTGLYAATESLRFQATRSAQARMRMETALWALHGLHQFSSQPGILARFVDPTHHPQLGNASKDTYTGFFYAVGQCWPWIQNPRLRKALQEDVDSLAGFFLDDDLHFIPSSGTPLDLNPYFSIGILSELFQEFAQDASLRHAVLLAFALSRHYFQLMGQKPPVSFAAVETAVRRQDRAGFQKIVVPFLNDVLAALKLVELNVARSARPAQRMGLSDSPYQRLQNLLQIILNRFSGPTPIQHIEDFKILPSQALLSLHILKVAATILPQPNRYQRYYADNLNAGKGLLTTALNWSQWDEVFAASLFGESHTARVRGNSNHLPYLALMNLAMLDPERRADYVALFERQRLFQHNDLNAMTDLLAGHLGIQPDPTGIGYWTLHRYPESRRGLGEDYWQRNGLALANQFGGLRDGFAREPIPPDLRPRDASLWQRNAHSIRRDAEGWEYAPVDYLWVWWMSQAAKRDAVSEKR